MILCIKLLEYFFKTQTKTSTLQQIISKMPQYVQGERGKILSKHTTRNYRSIDPRLDIHGLIYYPVACCLLLACQGLLQHKDHNKISAHPLSDDALLPTCLT